MNRRIVTILLMGIALFAYGVDFAAAAPTLSFTAYPTAVQRGQASSLSWSASGVTSCQASGASDWSGAKPVSGNQLVDPVVTTTYTLSCTGGTGTVTRSVTVSLLADPSIQLAVPNGGESIELGSQYSISWNATNPTDISHVALWIEFGNQKWAGIVSGLDPADGGATVLIPSERCLPTGCSGAIDPRSDYRILAELYEGENYCVSNCSVNPQAKLLDTDLSDGYITLTPETQTPTADLKVDGSDGPVQVYRGERVTISWQSNYTNYCILEPFGWGGVNASQDTTNLQPQYDLYCRGPGGLASDTVSMIILEPPTDLTGDGRVDIVDLGVLLGNWQRTDVTGPDINRDGIVDIIDLGMLLSAWTVV